MREISDRKESSVGGMSKLRTVVVSRTRLEYEYLRKVLLPLFSASFSKATKISFHEISLTFLSAFVSFEQRAIDLTTKRGVTRQNGKERNRERKLSGRIENELHCSTE